MDKREATDCERDCQEQIDCEDETHYGSQDDGEVDKRLQIFFDENDKLQSFLKINKVDPSEYKSLVKDYIMHGTRCLRLRGFDKQEETWKELRAAVAGCERHPLFSDLVLLPRNLKVNSLPLFEEQRVCGIEASSAIVVLTADMR